MKIKSILITGGTGSFGKTFIKRILETYPDIERLVIYSRDELKQFEMAQFYTANKFPQIRFFRRHEGFIKIKTCFRGYRYSDSCSRSQTSRGCRI